MLFIRALFAFLMVPVIVTGLIPFLLFSYDPYRISGSLWGLISLAIGLVILLWCVRDFYSQGKGTLAPWDPPKHLVTVGLYRYVRNPMYVGIFFILLGWIITSGSPIITAFACLLFTGFYFRVKTHEEPWAEDLFGSEWLNYKNNVPRWIPQLKAYRPKQ